jgi:addiction module HigA family antidote
LIEAARRKLRRIEAAQVIDDLRVPPGNRLEALQGATDVEIVDYTIELTRVVELRMQRALHIPTHGRPTPPGEMLLEEFLKPLGVTQTEFARRIRVTYPRLNEIVRGKRAVTMDTAMRFARALHTSVDFWLRLQLAVDLYDARHSPKAKHIAKIRPLYPKP